MSTLSVGQPYDPSVASWPEGCHYNYDASGHWLHYLFNNPSQVEIVSIQKGPGQFGLYVQDPVIFLLHQFGDMPWNDAPYSWWLVSEQHRKLPEIGPGEHALLKVVLIDTATGIVSDLRALTFSSEFTRKLHEEILRQSETPSSSIAEYHVITMAIAHQY
jgi:hypothetical protein